MKKIKKENYFSKLVRTSINRAQKIQAAILLKLKLWENFLTILLLIFIIVGAFVARLYKIHSPVADWHSWRQADTASVARIYVANGIDLLHPRYYDVSSIQTGYLNLSGERYVEFPLYNAVHAGMFKLLPSVGFDEMGRLVSIFSSLITIIFIYLIGRKFISRLGGLFSAFFFAFMPFNIYYDRVILPAPMALLFSIMSIWAFAKFCENNNLLTLFSGSAFFALSILINPYVAFYAIPLMYLALRKYGFKVLTNIPLYIALDIALIPLFMWRAFIFEKVVGIPPVAWAFNGDSIRFRPAFWWWILGQRLGSLILGIWGAAVFVLGFVKTNTKNLLVEATMFGAFVFVSVVATANVRHDYYQSMIIPAVVLVLGKGADYLWHQKGLVPKLSIFGISFLMFIIGAYQVKEYYKVNHPEFVTAGAYIDSIASPDDKVIAPNNGDTAFLYQTKRFGWPVIDRSLQETIDQGAHYYVSVTKNDTDTVNFKKEYKTIKEEQNYIVIDLHQPLKQK